MPEAESHAARDLVALVPDSNYEQGIESLLQRPESLRISPISFDIYTHMHRDPGCLRESHEFLRPLIADYRFAMVLFDRDGCGQEDRPTEEIQRSVQTRLERNGWNAQSRVLVVDPEFDAWVWSDSPHVPAVLGWPDDSDNLRHWLRQQGFEVDSNGKPSNPKEAMERVLRTADKPRSASIYARLGEQVSVRRCTDPTFSAFKETLRDWFPPSC